MLSVCIPVYNFHILPLVKKLAEQCAATGIPYEIIVIDDGSEAVYKAHNRPLRTLANYVELDKNIGRAAIRNLFLHYARYPYLLFLDCDAEITRDDFIKKYVDEVRMKTPVVCGGRDYPTKKPIKNYRLRWKYGIEKENKSPAERMKEPNRSFMTNNFLISKNILQKIRFDERLKHYGHEDTLFGYRLKKAGIVVKHIDNPVLNAGIEKNEIYVSKTEQSVKNLSKIVEITGNDAELEKDVSLLHFYNQLKKQKRLWPVMAAYAVSAPVLKKLLQKGYFTLPLFNFYKLGVFATEEKKRLSAAKKATNK